MDEEMDEGEDHMKGMLYTIYSFILHQQRLRAQEQLLAGASSLPACRLASSPPPPPALCSPTSPVDWDRLRQPVGFHLQYATIPKIRNKYFQKRKCEASVPICLCAIYDTHDRSAYSACRKICGPILGIYKYQ
jgi:hypothetical protein